MKNRSSFLPEKGYNCFWSFVYILILGTFFKSYVPTSPRPFQQSVKDPFGAISNMSINGIKHKTVDLVDSVSDIVETSDTGKRKTYSPPLVDQDYTDWFLSELLNDDEIQH